MQFKIRTFLIIFLASLPLTTHAQITLTKTSNMSFGTIGYDATHNGTITLGTNGIVSLIGGTGLSYNGGGTAGIVGIVGTPLDVIEIKCESTGKMRLGNQSIDVQNVEVAIDSGVAFGSANSCNDIKKNSPPATTVDLAVNSTPNVLMGGQAVITANSLNSGTYTTTSAGAQPITLRVIFQ